VIRLKKFSYQTNTTKSKYKNKKTVINGLKFDSKKEGMRYLDLLEKLNLGQISGLELQPQFELQPKYKKDGKTIRALVYKADFAYYDKDGNYIVEDVKGSKYCLTDHYKIKKKIFEYKYPYKIKEIY